MAQDDTLDFQVNEMKRLFGVTTVEQQWNDVLPNKEGFYWVTVDVGNSKHGWSEPCIVEVYESGGTFYVYSTEEYGIDERVDEYGLAAFPKMWIPIAIPSKPEWKAKE